MRILDSIVELAGLKGPIVLAAGTFDGVHLGHQALIRSALEAADSCGGTAVIMTFDRHPASLLRPEMAPRLLTRNAEKVELLEGMGVQALLLLEFTKDLASVTARQFIGSLARSCAPLHAVCVGFEWTFGKGGEGNASLLRELGQTHGFSVMGINPSEIYGSPISSTRVRNAIGTGDFDLAGDCLGRPWILSGKVVTGQNLGKTIGFPTANLDVDGMQLPPDGVYAVRVHHEGSVHPGVCNIGLRPTVDPGATHRTVEAHLFDLSEDLVGKILGLEFVRFLRGEQKFSGLEELKAQIARDCISGREIL